VNNESGILKPNQLSEKLLKCLIGIFLELKQTSLDKEGSSVVPKLTLSCMNSKGFMPKTSFNCKSSATLFNYNTSHVDPYCILSDVEGSLRDVGPYKNFIQITRSSVDIRRLSDCLNGIGKLRWFVGLVSNDDFSFLHIQNLFSINSFLLFGSGL
jgi:hypothetical protein